MTLIRTAHEARAAAAGISRDPRRALLLSAVSEAEALYADARCAYLASDEPKRPYDPFGDDEPGEALRRVTTTRETMRTMRRALRLYDDAQARAYGPAEDEAR